MKIFCMVVLILIIAATAADPVSQRATQDCYNGYIGMKNKFKSRPDKDPYAPNQASGLSLCRVLLEHEDRDPAYDWAFQSVRSVIPGLDDLQHSLRSREGVCRVGGILYLKKYHRSQLQQGLKVLENHCR